MVKYESKNTGGIHKMYHATSIVRDTIVFMCSIGICALLPLTYMMCGFLDMGKIRVVRKKGRENDRRRWAFVHKRKLFSFGKQKKMAYLSNKFERYAWKKEGQWTLIL